MTSMLTASQNKQYEVVESTASVNDEYNELVDLVYPWKKTKKGKKVVRIKPKK